MTVRIVKERGGAWLNCGDVSYVISWRGAGHIRARALIRARLAQYAMLGAPVIRPGWSVRR